MTERSGIGYDIHPTTVERKLILAGVEIDGPGLIGHSDGDVLSHAICDAILGACNLGDLGVNFPESDERFKDVQSIELLRKTAQTVRGLGWIITFIDATVIASEPELHPYRSDLRRRVAEAVNIRVDDVNIKFKSNNSIGDVGEGKAIQALAISNVKQIFGK